MVREIRSEVSFEALGRTFQKRSEAECWEKIGKAIDEFDKARSRVILAVAESVRTQDGYRLSDVSITNPYFMLQWQGQFSCVLELGVWMQHVDFIDVPGEFALDFDPVGTPGVVRVKFSRLFAVRRNAYIAAAYENVKQMGFWAKERNIEFDPGSVLSKVVCICGKERNLNSETDLWECERC